MNIEELKEISTPIEINPNWLYHWIINKQMLYSVYEYGILSKENLRKHQIPFVRDNNYNPGCNGTNYISVCKKNPKDSFAYDKYIRGASAFIIREDIPKINTLPITEEFPKSKLLKSILGTRTITKQACIVNHRDEYLVKDKINFKDIVGLKLPINYDEEDILQFINFLEQINYYLPIIDIENKLEINQQYFHKKLKR